LAREPLTSIFPPSQASFAWDRVLNRQDTSSQTSRRTEVASLSALMRREEGEPERARTTRRGTRARPRAARWPAAPENSLAPRLPPRRHRLPGLRRTRFLPR